MSRSRTRRIRVYWQNPPAAALTVEHIPPSGQTILCELGPRGLLNLDEAACALERPRDEVLRAIHAGFLRAIRRGRQYFVTVRACFDFLREENADARAQDQTLARIRTGRERVIPWKIVRQSL